MQEAALTYRHAEKSNAPAPGVVVEELHALNHCFIVPLSKDNDAEAVLFHVDLELLHLLWVELFLAVCNQQRSVVGGIEARNGLAKNLRTIQEPRGPRSERSGRTTAYFKMRA